MAQTIYTIQQGESQLLVVEVTEEGTNIDLVTDVVNIFAEIKIQGKDEVVIPYSLQTSSGRASLTVNPSENYQLIIPLERDQSKQLDIGSLICNVVVSSNDSQLPNGVAHNEYSGFVIGSITKGNLKDVDF